MSYIKKYIKGPRIATVERAVNLIMRDQYLIFHDTPKHPSWCGNWHVNDLIRYTKLGQLHEAYINPEWKEKRTEDDE